MQVSEVKQKYKVNYFDEFCEKIQKKNTKIIRIKFFVTHHYIYIYI